MLDHLGGLHACPLNDTQAWAAAARLANAGAWLKLSGWYRSNPVPVVDHLDSGGMGDVLTRRPPALYHPEKVNS